jgi:hypothetical protein
MQQRALVGLRTIQRERSNTHRTERSTLPCAPHEARTALVMLQAMVRQISVQVAARTSCAGGCVRLSAHAVGALGMRIPRIAVADINFALNWIVAAHSQ